METLRNIQNKEYNWRTTNNINETPQHVFHRLQGEMAELFETVFHDGKTKVEVASELADVAIFAIGLMSMYGVDAERAISGKLNRNFDKYDPAVRQRLIEGGMTNREAELYQKSIWDSSRDKEYLQDIDL